MIDTKRNNHIFPQSVRIELASSSKREVVHLQSIVNCKGSEETKLKRLSVSLVVAASLKELPFEKYYDGWTNPMRQQGAVTQMAFGPVRLDAGTPDA